MVVNDANYGVTWQIYKEGTEWKYRLLNGMFYVDAVATTNHVISPTASKVKLGYLYDNLEILDTGGLAPSDWRVPSKDDWDDLIDFIRTDQGATTPISSNEWPIGVYLADPRKTGFPIIDSRYITDVSPKWDTTRWYGRNTYNFSALPTVESGDSSRISFLSSTYNPDLQNDGLFYSAYEYTIYLLPITRDLRVADAGNSVNLSVRLVRDATVTEQGYDDGTFCDDIEDYDGNVYNTVKIDDKVWTVQNWACEHFDNGDEITNLTYPDSDETLVFYGDEEVDGFEIAIGSNILFAGQDNPTENGIWTKTEDGWERHSIFSDGFSAAGILFNTKNGDTLKNSIWLFANYGDITINTTKLYFQQLINNPLTTEFDAVNIAADVPNNFALEANDYYSVVDATLANTRIILGSGLIPGKQYVIVKKDDSDNIVLVTNSSNTENVDDSFFVVLEKENDWCIVTPLENNEFIIKSNTSQVVSKEVSDDDITVTKELRYVDLSGDDDDLDITFDHNLYSDRAYVLSMKVTGTHSIFNYDSLSAESSYVISEGIERMIVVRPPDKFLAIKSENHLEDGQIAFKLPAGFKLKDIIVENPTDVVHTQAEGLITITGGTMIVDETFTIGDEVFTFKMGTPTNPFEIKRLNSSGYDLSIEVMNVINNDSTYVDCTRVTSELNNSILKITAKSAYAGAAGNAIATTETVTSDFVFDAATLEGGESKGNQEVTINIGTTSVGSDVVSAETIAVDSLNTFNIQKVFSLSDVKDFYISSANWDDGLLNIYLTREEVVSGIVVEGS